MSKPPPPTPRELLVCPCTVAAGVSKVEWEIVQAESLARCVRCGHSVELTPDALAVLNGLPRLEAVEWPPKLPLPEDPGSLAFTRPPTDLHMPLGAAARIGARPRLTRQRR